jgi:hypothetical protein
LRLEVQAKRPTFFWRRVDRGNLPNAEPMAVGFGDAQHMGEVDGLELDRILPLSFGKRTLALASNF